MKTRFDIPAVVLGMSVNGIGAVRSLGRNGVPVYAIASSKDMPSMHTRYAKCLAAPDVVSQQSAFHAFLENLARDIGKKAVLLPTSDSYNEFVNARRDSLERLFHFAMPPKVFMDQLLDKKGQYLLAKSSGTPVPDTYFPQSEEEVKKISQNLHYPVIIKGLSTTGWRKRFGDKKAVLIKNEEELLSTYKDIKASDEIEPVIQEVIEGDDMRHFKYCAYFDRNHEPVLEFTLQKIRQYPCDFGIGCCVKSVQVPELFELGRRFMKAANYWGIGSIEFKKDSRDDQFKMIEINARLWAQNSLPEACGQNYALTAYKDLIGEKVKPTQDFEEGVYWIASEEDRASFKGYFKQRRIQLWDWLKTRVIGKHVWSLWSWDDPLPFLKYIQYGFLPVTKLFNRLRLKVNRVDRSVADES